MYMCASSQQDVVHLTPIIAYHFVVAITYIIITVYIATFQCTDHLFYIHCTADGPTLRLKSMGQHRLPCPEMVIC